MKKIIVLALIFFSCAIYCFGENNNTYNIFSVKQENIDEIIVRFDNNTLTIYDKQTINNIYKDIIFFGGIIYPEASKILSHYIFGNGSDLYIVSDYFLKSKVIVNALINNPNREIIGPITLRISDDPRIAYAINGFYIKTGNPIEIYQIINFAGRNDRNTFTVFNILGKQLKIPDRLIRTFEENGGCKTFTVRIKSKYN
jgi:hypothetical protein